MKKRKTRDLCSNILEVRDVLYGDGAGTNQVEVHKYNTYIGDKPQNKDILEEIMTNDQKLKVAMIAPTGAGKTLSLIEVAKNIVKKDSNRKVVLAFPTYMQAMQSQNYNIEQLCSGYYMDCRKKVVGCTYEKVENVMEYVVKSRNRGNKEKITFIVDEAHLCILQNDFRGESIQTIIKCIEKNIFDNIIFVTSTPMSLALYHFDKIIEFEPITPIRNIKQIEILQVDKVDGYIEQLDYKNEFPLIRYNNKDDIDKCITEMSTKGITLEKITSETKWKKLYDDIIRYEKIDKNNLDGILATSVLDVGTNINLYPQNMVPIAIFDSYLFNLDDVEQFFNRARNSVPLARVVIPKREDNIQVCLLEKCTKNVVCQFNDIDFRFEKGHVTINDVKKMNTIPCGEYCMEFNINKTIFHRNFKIKDLGPSDDENYSKDDQVPIMFNNLGFRSFINILSYNCERVERFGEVLQGYLDVLWASRQTLPTTQAMIDAEIDDNILIEKMTKAAIEEIGKLSIALNYDSNVKKILVDKRLVFMVSYEEFQRQFLRSPKLIKMELEGRMNTSVCIKELNVNAAIKNKVNEDDIWENLDALRLWLELNASDDLYNKIMDSRYNYCNDPHINEIHEMRRQTHLMDYLKNLKKYGITNEMALKILAFSKSKRKINKYKRLYYVIVSNEMLERLEKEDAKDAILYNKKLKDKMQVAIYCYIKKKNQQTFTQSKTLNSEIILYYHTQFPNEKKKITDRKMTNTINNMYKSSGQKRKGELRTCEKDIFKVIESDYK